MSSVKTIIPERDIVVMWITINDEVINNLRAVDDLDKDLNFVIRAYINELEEMGEEIFEYGNTYLVTEKAVYLAVYQDELTEDHD